MNSLFSRVISIFIFNLHVQLFWLKFSELFLLNIDIFHNIFVNILPTVHEKHYYAWYILDIIIWRILHKFSISVSHLCAIQKHRQSPTRKQYFFIKKNLFIQSEIMTLTNKLCCIFPINTLFSPDLQLMLAIPKQNRTFVCSHLYFNCKEHALRRMISLWPECC